MSCEKGGKKEEWTPKLWRRVRTLAMETCGELMCEGPEENKRRRGYLPTYVFFLIKRLFFFFFERKYYF